MPELHHEFNFPRIDRYLKECGIGDAATRGTVIELLRTCLDATLTLIHADDGLVEIYYFTGHWHVRNAR